MQRSFSFLLAVLACAATTATAAEPSCARQLGQQRATALAAQCRKVSPATHPPCNAANSCALVVGEIERGCGMLEGEAYQPDFCRPALPRGARSTVDGILVAGGGADDRFIAVLGSDGRRVQAYCGQQCGELFEESEDGEEMTLRAGYRGRPVRVELAVERNGGRIAGPGREERLAFVKRLTLLK